VTALERQFLRQKASIRIGRRNMLRLSQRGYLTLKTARTLRLFLLRFDCAGLLDWRLNRRFDCLLNSLS
jgi:hypothetical protein